MVRTLYLPTLYKEKKKGVESTRRSQSGRYGGEGHGENFRGQRLPSNPKSSESPQLEICQLHSDDHTQLLQHQMPEWRAWCYYRLPPCKTANDWQIRAKNVLALTTNTTTTRVHHGYTSFEQESGQLCAHTTLHARGRAVVRQLSHLDRPAYPLSTVRHVLVHAFTTMMPVKRSNVLSNLVIGLMGFRPGTTCSGQISYSILPLAHH
jgi:hypothetical protein